MTYKTHKKNSDTDSRKSRFDWSKTTDSTKSSVSGNSVHLEVKRSIVVLVLSLVTLSAIGVGLVLIWLVPSNLMPSLPEPPLVNPDSREYLLIHRFEVNRNPLLLTPFDDEHFCVIGKGSIQRYSISGDLKESWGFPRELAGMIPTAACWVNFPENDNPFYKTFLLAFGDCVYNVRPGQKMLSVTRLPLAIPSEARILSLAWGGDCLFLADYAKGLIYQYQANDFQNRSVLGEEAGPSGFPGFHLSKTPCFGIAYSPKANLLYATNSAMFRVEVFDPESRLWLKERSWGDGPWRPDGFTGCCNPVGLGLLQTGQIVTTEKGKDPLVRVFTADGTQVCQVNAPNETLPLDGKSWLRTVVLNDARFVLLSPRGTAYVYERVFNPDNAVLPRTVSPLPNDTNSPDDSDVSAPTGSAPSATSTPNKKEAEKIPSKQATNSAGSVPAEVLKKSPAPSSDHPVRKDDK